MVHSSCDGPLSIITTCQLKVDFTTPGDLSSAIKKYLFTLVPDAVTPAREATSPREKHTHLRASFSGGRHAHEVEVGDGGVGQRGRHRLGARDPDVGIPAREAT